MTKKIRLIDDDTTTVADPSDNTTSNASVAELLKYAEAIDWKLWEILKILERNTPSK